MGQPAFGWAGLVLLAGLAMTAMVAWKTKRDARERDEWRFQAEVRERWEALETLIEKHEGLLLLLQDFVAANLESAGAEFTRRWQARVERLSLHLNFPGWLDVGYAPIVGNQGPARPAGNGTPRDHTRIVAWEVSVPVTHHFCVAPVPNLLGTNLIAPRQADRDPATGKPFLNIQLRRMVDLGGNDEAAKTLARRSHRIAIENCHNRQRPFTTTPFTLALPSHDSGPIVFRMFAPVYAPADLERPPGEPRALAGVVFGTMCLDSLLEIVLKPEENLIQAEVFIDRREWEPNCESAPRWGAVTGGSYWHKEAKWVMPRRVPPQGGWEANFTLKQYLRPWHVHAYSTERFAAQTQQGTWQWAAGMGAGLTFALTGLVWTRARREEEALRLAEQLRNSEVRTREATEARARVWRELHDRTLQSLFTTDLSLQRCQRQMAGEAMPEGAPNVNEQLETSLEMVQEISRDLRQIVLLMDPPRGGPERFEADFHEWMNRVGRATGAELRVRIDPEFAARVGAEALPEWKAVAGECVSNALRHGHAGRIEVALSLNTTVASLRVEDDGLGFEPSEVRHGGGFNNLAARAARLGGTYRIESTPGGPTVAALTAPLNAAIAKANGNET